MKELNYIKLKETMKLIIFKSEVSIYCTGIQHTRILESYKCTEYMYCTVKQTIVVRNMGVLGQHRTSCVKQCYSICACILYSIVCNPQKESIVYVFNIRV